MLVAREERSSAESRCGAFQQHPHSPRGGCGGSSTIARRWIAHHRPFRNVKSIPHQGGDSVGGGVRGGEILALILPDAHILSLLTPPTGATPFPTLLGPLSRSLHHHRQQKKSHPAALRHLSHGQHEPDGSHSLAPRPADNAHEQSKFQPVPDGSRGTARKIARDGPIAPSTACNAGRCVTSPCSPYPWVHLKKSPLDALPSPSPRLCSEAGRRMLRTQAMAGFYSTRGELLQARSASDGASPRWRMDCIARAHTHPTSFWGQSPDFSTTPREVFPLSAFSRPVRCCDRR